MLNARWVGERVAVPDLNRIRRNIAGQHDDVSRGPNNTFRRVTVFSNYSPKNVSDGYSQ